MDGIKEAFYVIIGLASAILLFLASLQLAGYLLKGAALSRMARNAGIPNAALAWVPVANNYLLGVLCDRAVLVQKGKRRGFAIFLPVGDVLGLVFGRSLLVSLLDLGEKALASPYRADPMDLMKGLVSLGFLLSFTVALWHLYRDYAPERAVLFTALSVIFGSVAQGAVLFAIRGHRPLSAGEFPLLTPPAPPPPQPFYPAGNRDGWYQPGLSNQRPYRRDDPPPKK